MTSEEFTQLAVDASTCLVWASGLMVGGLSLCWAAGHNITSFPEIETFGQMMGSLGMVALFMIGATMILTSWVPFPLIADIRKERATKTDK